MRPFDTQQNSLATDIVPGAAAWIDNQLARLALENNSIMQPMRRRWLARLHEAAVTCNSLYDLAERALPLMMVEFGAHAGALFHFAPGSPVYCPSPGSEPLGGDSVREYLDNFAASDPYFIQNTKRNREIDLASEQVGVAEASRSAVVSEVYRPRRYGDWLCARLGDAPVNHMNYMGVHLMRERRGAWRPRDAERFRPTYGYLRATLNRINRTRCDQQLLSSALESLAIDPTIIIDERGDVMWLSRSAEARFSGTLFARVPDTIRSAALGLLAGSRRESTLRSSSMRVTLTRVRTSAGARLVIARMRAVGTVDEMTSREREVVYLLAAKRTPKEIAFELGISHSTVRVLISRAMAKLKVESVRDLLRQLPARPD